MTDGDVNKFAKVVDDKLNKALEPVHHKLDALTGDEIQIQDELKAIKDKIGLGHTRNKREIDEIKTHLGLPLMGDTPEI